VNLKADDTDDDLVASLQKGDEQAFRSLFEKYGVRLYQFSLKFLKNKEDAEDLLDEVFLKIWENRQSLKTNLSFQAYLFTIAYNNIRQRFIRRSREEKYIQIFAKDYLIYTSKDEDQVDYYSFVEKISRIVDLLPPRRKEIFLLNYKDELKNEQIGEKLGVSENFVRKQLAIARKFIIEKIKEDNCIAGILLIYLFTRQELD
jgi:RNA polymerase sigma-70 factor (family 1)